MTEIQQLSGMDSIFLAAETERTPMHVSAALLYQAPGDGSNLEAVSTIDLVVDRFEKILDVASVFRKKLVKPLMTKDHPYWSDDANFDLLSHFHHYVFEEPVGRVELNELICEIHAQQLDLARPLWEAHVIEGASEIDEIGENGFVIVLKVHHAAVDGMSLLKIIAALHSTEPVDNAEFELDDGVEPTENWNPQSQPSQWDMLWNSYSNSYKRNNSLVKTLREVLPVVTRKTKKSSDAEQPKKGVKTRFNSKIEGAKVFDTIDFDFTEIIKCRRKVPGSTVNDVVVSIVGGGLRHYLELHNELPQESLITGAPINIRGKSDVESSANMISMMRIPLASNVADPIERLREVKARSREAKIKAKKFGLNTLTDLAQSIDPQLLVLGVRAINSDVFREMVDAPPVHTMVSNVPGPREKLFMGSSQLSRVLGLGPLKDQAGLFHAVTSVGKVLSVSFVSCTSILPDPAVYRECLQKAYLELVSSDG